MSSKPSPGRSGWLLGFYPRVLSDFFPVRLCCSQISQPTKPVDIKDCLNTAPTNSARPFGDYIETVAVSQSVSPRPSRLLFSFSPLLAYTTLFTQSSMAQMRRALHLGKTAYFTFDIEILDVVNIPFPQGRFLVKWNFKSGLLSSKDAEHHAAQQQQHLSSSSKPPTAVSVDPAYAHHHLAPPGMPSSSSSSMHHSVYSSASSIVSIDPPSDPDDDDSDSEHPEAASSSDARAGKQQQQQQPQPQQSKPPTVLNHNDRVGFSHPVKLNRSHTAEFKHTLRCSVGIPVRENRLEPCEVKFSVRHQYLCSRGSGKWQTSKLGETFIDLSQYAHKAWRPNSANKPSSSSRYRDEGSAADTAASEQRVQRFLLQHGKTNALLRLKFACTMIGGETYKESHLKGEGGGAKDFGVAFDEKLKFGGGPITAQEKHDLPKSDSASSISPSARSRSDRPPDDSDCGGSDGTRPTREHHRSTDGRTAQEVVDDIWIQARRDVAMRKSSAAGGQDSSASTVSSRAPSSDGVIMPEPRRASEDEARRSSQQQPSPQKSSTHSQGAPPPPSPAAAESPVKKRSSPMGHLSLAVPATFRKRTESTTTTTSSSKTPSLRSFGQQSRQRTVS